MTDERFIVENDGVIVTMVNLPDSEIPYMIGSGFFTSVFRLSTNGVEYADVDQITNVVEWKEAEQLKEEQA